VSETEYARCAICSTYQVACPSHAGTACSRCGGSGFLCPSCAEPEKLAGTGWSTTTAWVPLKQYKEQIRAILDHLLSPEVFGASGGGWEPRTAKTGKVNREAFYEGWHVGIEESKSGAEGGTVFLGLAENESRGCKCRLPSQWVQRIRDKACPGLECKSL
jgi:hypothetical protein